MVYGGLPGGHGFGEHGFGFGGHGFGGHDCGEHGLGFGGHGFGGPGLGFGGPGFGGHGFGFGGRGFGLRRAAFGTLALLLDGPADAAQIVQRASDATGGALTPPQEVAELAIGLLAGRGLVTVDGGVATLSELGKMCWRGGASAVRQPMHS